MLQVLVQCVDDGLGLAFRAAPPRDLQAGMGGSCTTTRAISLGYLAAVTLDSHCVPYAVPSF
jgi:hypothetical protein